MHKKHTPSVRLSLKHETVRILNTQQLIAAVGGSIPESKKSGCPECTNP